MLELNATFIAVILNFLVLMWVLNYFLYKPVLKLLNDRKSYVENTLAEADAKMSQAKASIEEGLQVVNNANLTAKKIMDEAATASAKLKEEELDRAKKDIEQMKRRAKDEISQMKIEARSAITRDAAKLSVIIAEKILKKRITMKVQRSMIDDFIDGMKN